MLDRFKFLLISACSAEITSKMILVPFLFVFSSDWIIFLDIVGQSGSGTIHPIDLVHALFIRSVWRVYIFLKRPHKSIHYPLNIISWLAHNLSSTCSNWVTKWRACIMAMISAWKTLQLLSIFYNFSIPRNSLHNHDPCSLPVLTPLCRIPVCLSGGSHPNTLFSPGWLSHLSCRGPGNRTTVLCSSCVLHTLIW